MIWKFGKDKLKKAEKKLDSISKEDIKKGATEVTGAVLENGIEVVKTGLFGMLNGILLKIIIVVTFIIVITAGGCVVTSVTVNKLTGENTVEVNNVKG